MNIGVDCQITWPSEETLVEFEGYKLILFPKTRDKTTSIHVDLYRNRITDDDALTLINRFLSLKVWCDDAFAVTEGGWSGSPIPIAVEKRDLAFTTAFYWLFDRHIPQTDEGQRAIAIYREARNAEENSLVSYAVLGYYKVIELKHKGRADAKKWFGANFEKIKEHKQLADDVETFILSCGNEKPQDYLYRACRTAVAHANKPYSIDPDDEYQLQRLHVATRVLRELARLFIREELGVSDHNYDRT